MLDYQLVRSARRKSVALQIKSGQLVVRAPYGVSNQQIAHFVHSKRQWVESKLTRSRMLSEELNHHGVVLKHGGRLWLKGQKLKLVVSFAAKQAIINHSNQLELVLPNRYQAFTEKQINHKIKTVLGAWFKQQLSLALEQKLAYYGQHTQLTAKSVKIRQYKARWGSCDNWGRLSFNYLLMMVPDWVLDYVIIHELCHLKYLDHSPQFWQLVATHYPEYLAAKCWLKQHQYYLNWPSLT